MGIDVALPVVRIPVTAYGGDIDYLHCVTKFPKKLLRLQGEGGDGGGVDAAAPHPHPSPPLEGEGIFFVTQCNYLGLVLAYEQGEHVHQSFTGR